MLNVIDFDSYFINCLNLFVFPCKGLDPGQDLGIETEEIEIGIEIGGGEVEAEIEVEVVEKRVLDLV